MIKKTNNINKALEYIWCFLNINKTEFDLHQIWNECLRLAGYDYSFKPTMLKNNISYDELQMLLSKLNEKEENRKDNGVYYTSRDVVNFILFNCIKAFQNRLSEKNISISSKDIIIDANFVYKINILEPTCGVGEFLLAAFELKVSYLKKINQISVDSISRVLRTIHGNDINPESIILAKIRMFLSIVMICGQQIACDCTKDIDNSFSSIDFINMTARQSFKYDIIVGNPPYIEDAKYGKLDNKYGNVYCNVLVNSTFMLSEGGVIGFIIPLSYTSTPRMKKIRETISANYMQQFILHYADRPDCLFSGVHQKLCILIASKMGEEGIYTSKYHYWYKEERENLFKDVVVVRNNYSCNDFIPKLGSQYDVSIYRKIIESPKCVSVYDTSRNGNECVYVNRRETFWIKAYRTLPYIDPELKIFRYLTKGEADYCYCLVNSSLFWWYWICTSDCWHISKKLNGFKAPQITKYAQATHLARILADKLEKTKIYIGTKQVDYEYKHNLCVNEIHKIDDFVNSLFELTESESEYIKQFSYKYRISGGPDYDKSN